MDQAPDNRKSGKTHEVQIPIDFESAERQEAAERQEKERIAKQYGLDPKTLTFKNGYCYDPAGDYLRDKSHDGIPHDQGGTYRGPGDPMH